MRKLKLQRTDLVAKVDNQDYNLVSAYKWYVLKSRTTKVLYAIRYWYDENGKHRSQLLHNLILGYRGVDHINGDGLDCQRKNLRPANKSQNAANISTHKDKKSSPYKGVYLDKRDGAWYSQIMKNGKVYHLGRFLTPEDARDSYNYAANNLFGVYAKACVAQ